MPLAPKSTQGSQKKKKKLPWQDCLSDSGKLPQGDALSYLPQEVGQLVLVTITNNATEN